MITIIFFIGRIIFGVYWLKNSYSHLVARRKDMIGYAASKGVPAPSVAIVGTGILLLIGGLSMITGIWPRVGIAALIVFLLGVTFKMHAFWKETDPMMKMTQSINFSKNLALLGAVLMLSMIVLPWPWSLSI